MSEDIIRMAREAGSIDSEEVIETMWRAFSAAAREACAKQLDALGNDHCAAAIRARSKE